MTPEEILDQKDPEIQEQDQRHLKAVASAPKMPLPLVLNHRVIDSMALDPDETDQAFDDIYFALDSYTYFLKVTGRWTGTGAAYEELHSALGNSIAAAVPQLPAIQGPNLSDGHQDAAFNAMPLIKRASSLLDWFGTGREVTSTGALRLKDIEPAAAAVGILARGKRGASQALPLFDLESAEPRPKRCWKSEPCMTCRYSAKSGQHWWGQVRSDSAPPKPFQARRRPLGTVRKSRTGSMGFLKLANEPSDATESMSNVIALHGSSRTGRPSNDR